MVRKQRPMISAMERGVTACRTCGQLARIGPADRRACPRCGVELQPRKVESLHRTTAYLVAAAILYLPANLLPITHAGSITGNEDDTIMSGVMVLLNGGSWVLALLVFFASIVVPLAKLLALSALVLQVRYRWTSNLRALTQLYRLLEFVGRWSMLDIYVLTLLVALVQIKGVGSIEPRSGALAFAAVVVFTLLASRSFDPRLLWDSEHRG